MAVEQERCSGSEAGGHGQGLFGVQPDEDEALPGGTTAFRLGLELTQKALFELEDLENVHAADQRLASSGRGISENNIFEFVGTGRKNGSALVDFSGIEQVEDGKVLDGEDLVHAFNTETAFAVEEVGDVGLL